MDLSTLYKHLHTITQCRIVKSDVARALNIDPAQLRRKEISGIDLKQGELKTIADAFNVPIQSLINQENIKENIINFPATDHIEINYWDQLPDELKNPKIVSCWFDREIIENAWGMNADHLCIVPMVGDKMSRYWYPIRSGDILIVDTAQDHIMGNGVYFGTSQNNSRFWVREMQVLINREIEFSGYAPSGETKKVYTAAELEAVDFKMIGKVIKNVSFRL